MKINEWHKARQRSNLLQTTIIITNRGSNRWIIRRNLKSAYCVRLITWLLKRRTLCELLVWATTMMKSRHGEKLSTMCVWVWLLGFGFTTSLMQLWQRERDEWQ